MSTSDLKLEVNIALIPEPALIERLAAASADIASRYPTIVRLDGTGNYLSNVPHLTLYQAAFPYEHIPEVVAQLAQIAQEEHPYELASTGLTYNAEEASLEVRKEVTDDLVALQDKVIAATNLLRNGLLVERDPGGNVVAERLEAEGRLGENIRQTGYAEVGDPRQGGLFRPHDTLNWLVRGTELDVDSEQQRLQDTRLAGMYQGLGIYIMGPYGTCPQRLASFELGAR